MKIRSNILSFVLLLMFSPAFIFGQGMSISPSAYVINDGGYILVTANVVNSGTLTVGTGSCTISGNYTNSNIFSQSTGSIFFNGSSQVLIDNGSGTMFTNVFFNGNGGSGSPDIISSGNFSVSSAGILNMVNATTLNANGNLTLNSDATGSASVSAIPSVASITGNVNVQRFITGTGGHRGYRLLSSPVNAGNDTHGNKIYSINYLLASTFLTGTDGIAGGFSKAGNPTLYLYRENLTNPLYTSFTNSNFRGIRNISAAPAYTMDIDGGPYNIPVGNGYFFFFRGSAATVSPYVITTAPVQATLTATNTLNQGTIDVKDWFTPTVAALSYTPATVASEKGFNLLGNPYPCTINFEKFNRNGINSSIYGSGFTTPAIIYFFNPVSKQFCSYQQQTTISTIADTTTTVNPGISSDGFATNMIASGQGFFIKTTAAGQTFSFRETAKTTTQAAVASLNRLMSLRKDFAADPQPEPQSLVRLRLVKDSINTDEVVLLFNNHDSSAYSADKDALDLGGNGALESLSLLSSDTVKLSIHRRQFPKKTSQAVPLFVDATTTGVYQLTKIRLNLPPLYELWLKDALMKDSLDLIANDTYSFAVDKSNPASVGPTRFSLVIRQNPALAYHLLDFTAVKVTNAANVAAREVKLAWTTEHEQKFTKFTVEKSIDGGKNFNVIGEMNGNALGTYSILNKDPIAGINLYRLKQEDINNTVTYSKVVQVAYSDLSNSIAAGNISVYPNPAIGVLNIAISLRTGTDLSYTFRISNASGVLIRQVTSHQANWQTDVSNLIPGTYIVMVLNSRDGSIMGNTKFIKL